MAPSVQGRLPTPPQPFPPHPERVINLLVGNRRLHATPAILRNQCPFFQNYFRFDTNESVVVVEDCYYFDWDGVIFAYVLDYLRGDMLSWLLAQSGPTSGSILDEVMFRDVGDMAAMLGIITLRDWARNREYHQAVAAREVTEVALSSPSTVSGVDEMQAISEDHSPLSKRKDKSRQKSLAVHVEVPTSTFQPTYERPMTRSHAKQMAK